MLIDLTLKINPKNAVSKMAQLGHYGTHIDVMEENDIPIKNFITSGKLIDITDIRGKLIELKDIVGKASINENHFKAYCFPMHLSDSTGVPIRVIAEIVPLV